MPHVYWVKWTFSKKEVANLGYTTNLTTPYDILEYRITRPSRLQPTPFCRGKLAEIQNQVEEKVKANTMVSSRIQYQETIQMRMRRVLRLSAVID